MRGAEEIAQNEDVTTWSSDSDGNTYTVSAREKFSGVTFVKETEEQDRASDIDGKVPVASLTRTKTMSHLTLQ